MFLFFLISKSLITHCIADLLLCLSCGDLRLDLLCIGFDILNATHHVESGLHGAFMSISAAQEPRVQRQLRAEVQR